MPDSQPAELTAAALAGDCDGAISLVLERLGSWLRRATPAVEWNAVALSTLAELSRRGPLRISDLVAAERLTQPGMTSLVGRMDAAGLVTREQDPADGRATLVCLTEAGAAYVEHIHHVRAGVIAGQLAALPPAHREALAGALAAMDALAALPLHRGAHSL